MTTLSVAWSILIILLSTALCGSILWSLRALLQKSSAITRVLLTLTILASGLLLLRPHEDTFTGLDTSCYRLMGQAFAQGRQLHDTDHTLQELPLPLRRIALLEYQQWGRDTRDRSFQITSLKNCDIQPYFYPFLPMAAAGLDLLGRPHLGDYFVPFIGLLFFILILSTGAALGNKYGLLAGAVLLIGSPLPAYLFRGYYAEAVAATLVCIVLLGLTLSITSRLFRFCAPVAIGLAVGIHPVAIILALPALMMILMNPTLPRKGILLSLLGFAAGLLPLWAMTRWGCQPYGQIFDLHIFIGRLTRQPLQQFLAVFVLIFILGIAALVVGSTPLKTRLSHLLRRIISHPVFFLILLGLALSPLAIPISLWHGKMLVRTGLTEYWDGVRWGYGAILVAGLLASFYVKNQPRSRALLLITLFMAPFFFYLKGFEQMGLWSQRRLLPFGLLLIVALTPALASAIQLFSLKAGRFLVTLLSGGLLLAGLYNFSHWPAPYLTRHEKGTSQWVAAFAREIGQHLTFFDYYPYSVPFAASGSTRVIGLSEYGYEALPEISKWLAEQAAREEVLWVTAYDNPGLEDGVSLQSISHQMASFDRIVSKTALPAENRKYTVEIDLIRGIPITNATGLAVRKILDDGPLALRGPWGPRSPIKTNGQSKPARWSRQRSAIIGPIPPAGQSVRVTIEAAAARDDGPLSQTLIITPPWTGTPLRLTISNAFTQISGHLSRPADGSILPHTGTYTITAQAPYNPAKAGIRGYPKDLGAQIHLIAIETDPPP